MPGGGPASASASAAAAAASRSQALSFLACCRLPPRCCLCALPLPAVSLLLACTPRSASGPAASSCCCCCCWDRGRPRSAAAADRAAKRPPRRAAPALALPGRAAGTAAASGAPSACWLRGLAACPLPPLPPSACCWLRDAGRRTVSTAACSRRSPGVAAGAASCRRPRSRRGTASSTAASLAGTLPCPVSTGGGRYATKPSRTLPGLRAGLPPPAAAPAAPAAAIGAAAADAAGAPAAAAMPPGNCITGTGTIIAKLPSCSCTMTGMAACALPCSAGPCCASTCGGAAAGAETGAAVPAGAVAPAAAAGAAGCGAGAGTSAAACCTARCRMRDCTARQGKQGSVKRRQRAQVCCCATPKCRACCPHRGDGRLACSLTKRRRGADCLPPNTRPGFPPHRPSFATISA